MKLTADIIARSAQFVNALKDREIDLRGEILFSFLLSLLFFFFLLHLLFSCWIPFIFLFEA